MKDFLLTMIAMKRVEEPLLVPTANSASHGNANTFSVSRRPTETRLADDAKLYFDMFDVKQNGYIDIDELKLVMDFMIPVDDNSAVATRNKHIEDMFLIMDKAENGRVDFEEFKAFYNAVMIASTKNAIQTSLSKAITLAQAKGNSCDELLQENYLASRSLS